MQSQSKLEITVDRLLQHGWTIMFYDGRCIACSRGARYIAAHSPAARLAFCAAESTVGQRVLARLNPGMACDRTLVVVEAQGLWTGTEAVVKVTRHMAGAWRLMGQLLSCCPRFLCEPAYSWFARNRYRIAGRSDYCELPEGELRRRFIQ